MREGGRGAMWEGGGGRVEVIMVKREGKVCVLAGGPRERAHFCLHPWSLGRGPKRGRNKIKFNGQAQCHKTYLKENRTNLFSGAHIGHSLSVSAYPSKQLRKNVRRLKTIRMITWNPRACHVFYLHLMKRVLTQEMNGWQVQRSGAHTALCTLKYLCTSKRENCVTCVTIFLQNAG